MNSNGSNLNAGSTCSDVGGGSNTPVYTEVNSNFDGTSVFTPTTGQTTSSFVSVGDYVALYNTADTVARCIAKVTAVGAGVNGTITIDTTLKYGTVPTSNSGSRACRAGGSLADLAAFASPGAFNVAAAVPQDTRLNIKAGTYANTSSARSCALTGSATLGFWIRGYKTTPGDQDANNLAVAGTDIPAITFTTTGSLTFGTTTTLSNLDITGARTANAQVSLGATGQAYRCRFANTGAGATACALTVAGNCRIVACNLTVSSTSAAIVNGITSLDFFVGNVFTGGISAAVMVAQATHWYFNVFSGQAGDVLSFTTGGGANAIIGNTFYNAAGNGIVYSSTPAGVIIIVNNIFHTINQASKSAINNTSGTGTWLLQCIGNAYYNCTANTTGINENFAIFDNATLSVDPFVNAGGGNFSLTPAAQRLAFPGTNAQFENISAYNGYMSNGAIQPQSGMIVSNPFPGF